MGRVRDVDHGYKAFKQRMTDIKDSDAMARVGVFAGGDPREAVAPYQPAINALFVAAGLSKPAQEVTNVDIGVWMEFGVPQLQIPERSWLRSTFDDKHEAWAKFAERQVALLVDGKVTLEVALGRLGLLASSDVKKAITTGAGIPPPNAESTVKAKGSSRPLVDSGQFVGAITYDVVTGHEGEE